jgi:hypothetical protein
MATPDQASARADILDFLGWEEVDEENFALDTRILLAAADFSRELTTTVLWLRDRGIDIRCVRLKPYRLEDGRLLVDIQPLIPLPEAEEFQTKLGSKRLAERRERAGQEDLKIRFLQALLVRAQGRDVAHAGRTPSAMGDLKGSIGRAGFSINYFTRKTDTRVELLIQTEDAKQQFRQLVTCKEAIEAAFGGSLVWQEKEASRQTRVFHTVEGGYQSPEVDWPRIHDDLIDAMIRLDAALRPHVALLK